MKPLPAALLAALLSLGGATLAAYVIRAGSDEVASVVPALPDLTTSPEAVHQGEEFFALSCSHCHGDDAHGDEGPDLHNLAISNARIAATIQKGIKGEMPPFSKKYDAQQTAALVAYLRSLR